MNVPLRKVGVVLVFVKFPSPGRVKTRLAQTVGADRAAELYRDWIGSVLRSLQPLRPEFAIVGYIDGAEKSAFAPWRPLVDDWWPQPSGDLGVRLDDGFRQAHAVARRTVAIGTDCLDIDAHLARGAFDLLDRTDVVFGPARDGGYYLVGSRGRISGLFDEIRWSSPHTLDDQKACCARLGHAWSELPMRCDIDTWEDWREHCERLGRTP